MRELNSDEVKQIQIEILHYIAHTCKRESIRYYLGYGTLIGSVRHKGFIPWDDDIDIIMPREDYMKFLSVVDIEGVFGIVSMYKNADYCGMFAKIIDKSTYLIEPRRDTTVTEFGVYVDIFPVDGLPQNFLARFLHIKKLRFYRFMLDYSCFKICPQRKTLIQKIIKPILWKMSKLKDKYEWRNMVEKLTTKYPFGCSEWVGSSAIGVYYSKEVFPYDALSESVDGEFEGEIFPIPKGYDVYLSAIYGNYMELPPIEKRVTHHNYKAYLR